MRSAFRSLLWPVLGFSLVINLLWLAPALFSLQVFDRVLTSQSRETLVVLLLGMAVAFVLVAVLDYLRGRLQGLLGSIVNDALAPELARITLASSSRRQGPIAMEGLRDVGRLRALFSAQGLIAVLDAPWALIFLAVIWVAHPLLGVLATAAALLLLGLALLNHQLTRQPIEALQREAGEAQRYLDQAMLNAEVAEAMGMGPALVARWQTLSAQVAQQQQVTARLTVSMSTLTKVLRQAVQVVLQAAGAYLVIRGEATAGVMVATTTLMGRALSPVEQIVGSWRVLSEGLLAWQRIAPVIAQAERRAEPMELPRPKGVLLAQGLAYRVGERVLLNGISLSVHAGEMLAVIGPSGAGKSTLIRLLIGLWQPTAGSVRLDGVDVSKWSRDQLGPSIGYLPQDVELFAGTVADNIARLGPVNPDLVVAAARKAGVHELILGLQQGYDTRVDPHGALLSPGQRQRIGLARALYGEPRLVVLDEPNANLDQKGNEALANVLAQLKGQATVIMVTHRTEVLALADKLIVIEDGRASAFGTPTQVDQFLRQRAQGAAPRLAPQGPAGPGGEAAKAAAAAVPGRPAAAVRPSRPMALPGPAPAQAPGTHATGPGATAQAGRATRPMPQTAMPPAGSTGSRASPPTEARPAARGGGNTRPGAWPELSDDEAARLVAPARAAPAMARGTSRPAPLLAAAPAPGPTAHMVAPGATRPAPLPAPSASSPTQVVDSVAARPPRANGASPPVGDELPVLSALLPSPAARPAASAATVTSPGAQSAAAAPAAPAAPFARGATRPAPLAGAVVARGGLSRQVGAPPSGLAPLQPMATAVAPTVGPGSATGASLRRRAEAPPRTSGVTVDLSLDDLAAMPPPQGARR